MRLQGFNRLCASQNCLSEHNTPSSRSKLVCPTSTGYQQLSWQSKLSYQTSIVLQQAFLNLHKQLALNLFSPGLLNLYNPSTGNEVVKIVLLNFYRQSKLAWLQVFNRHCGSKWACWILRGGQNWPAEPLQGVNRSKQARQFFTCLQLALGLSKLICPTSTGLLGILPNFYSPTTSFAVVKMAFN